MIFTKDKKTRDSSSTKETSEEAESTVAADESKTKSKSRKKTISEYCIENNIKAWAKAGMMALNGWNDDSRVSHREFKDGLNAFNSRPQGG